MKITARASGGFSGRTACYELDTSCRPDGGPLEELVHQLDFFHAQPPCAIGADIPHWEITVEDGVRSRTLSVLEDGAAPQWQALLAHLRRPPA